MQLYTFLIPFLMDIWIFSLFPTLNCCNLPCLLLLSLSVTRSTRSTLKMKIIWTNYSQMVECRYVLLLNISLGNININIVVTALFSFSILCGNLLQLTHLSALMCLVYILIKNYFKIYSLYLSSLLLLFGLIGII